jgi:hypothetical protein
MAFWMTGNVPNCEVKILATASLNNELSEVGFPPCFPNAEVTKKISGSNNSCATFDNVQNIALNVHQEVDPRPTCH